MSLKSQIEAIIYAAEEPVTIEQMFNVLKDNLRATQRSGDSAEPNMPQLKDALRTALYQLLADYAAADRGMDIREVAGGYRMSTKPEHHDVVRAFVRSLKPPVRLSLPALETLAVIAYKQPITVPEMNEIRGVDCSGVIGTLLDRKLTTTAGRKQVIGRPILYRTTKEFLLRFGLGDISELPSMEEFEKLAAASLQADNFVAAAPDGPAAPPEEGPASEKPSVIELGERQPAEVAPADS
jgi:segregation and condensation protein B